LPELKYEGIVLPGIILLVISLFSFLILGFAGFRTVLSMLIAMFLPFYLVLNNFDLSQSEKFAFSFFIGIMLLPSLSYWLGFVVSFRISIFIAIAVLLLAAYAIKKFHKK